MLRTIIDICLGVSVTSPATTILRPRYDKEAGSTGRLGLWRQLRYALYRIAPLDLQMDHLPRETNREE